MKSKKPIKKSTQKQSKSKSKSKLLRILLFACVLLLLMPIIQLIAYKYVDPPLTWLMLERKFLPDTGYEIQELRHTNVPMENISRSMVFAVMSSEDQTFLDHNGIDIDAIEKALEYNESHKKKRGASTISQQTAKASSFNAYVNGKSLELKNVANGTAVEIFNALGAKVQSSQVVNGAVALNLSKGLYVVRVGKSTQKFMVK